MYSRLALLSIILICMVSQIAYAEYPDISDYEPKEAVTYAVVGEEMTLNDLVFYSRDDMPDPATLTGMERYMVWGAVSKADESKALAAWIRNTIGYVVRFYEEYGYIPERLTPDVIRSIPGFEDMPDGRYLEMARNPLTGEWPRLTASEHSPGDLYIRPLTDEEMQYFADPNTLAGRAYQKKWFEGKGFDAYAHAYEGVPYEDCFTVDIERVSDVYYYRLYGWNGVVEATLSWQSTADEPPRWAEELLKEKGY